MNCALIFAGGTGQRMNIKTVPKQFLELYQKPIIVYTLEKYENNAEIDCIVISCLAGWIDYCWKLVRRFKLEKVVAIVEGGETGQLSIYNGLVKIKEICDGNSIVLIHDGVRPIIDQDTILKNIACVKKNGSAITVAPVVETVTTTEGTDRVGKIIDRNTCRVAKAPQCFYLDDIIMAHNMALKENRMDFIDSASMMSHYGYPLFAIQGNINNIKITTPVDYYLFKAIIDANENMHILGI